MAAHRIYFGKGDQVVVTIPHRAGAPLRVTAGTYEIVDTRHGVDSADHVVVAAGTAASVDTASTTLTARAGRGASDRRAVTLADTAGLGVGTSYLLEGPAGQAELVRVAAVVSATVIRTAQEIRGDFAAGSTFRGVQVAATFPASPAADDQNLDGEPWAVIWSFAGLPPLREAIRLERGEETQLATLDDLRELDPMLALAGGDRIDPAAALARAHKDLRVDLQLAGISESDLLTGPIGRDAVCYRAAELCFQHGDDPVSERKAKSYGARYQELRAGLVVGAKKPEVVALDKSEETAETANPARLFYGFGFAPGG